MSPSTGQPRSAWLLDITPEPDKLLEQMKQKTRYNIRLAGRKRVTVGTVVAFALYLISLFDPVARKFLAIGIGLTIVGLTNLPATMPYHASSLYARNVTALLQHLAPEGELALQARTDGLEVQQPEEAAAEADPQRR